VLFLILASCSNLKKGTWGKKAIFPVKVEKIKNAFIKNITSAHVWAPVGISAIVYGLDYDKKISNWISNERLAYSDQTESDNYSDNWNIILKYEMYLSIFLPPSNSDKNIGHYFLNKAKGSVVVLGSEAITRSTQHWLRDKTNRLRPNLKDRNSLPSGHATQAGSRRVLTSKNLEASLLPQKYHIGLNTFNTLISIGTLVARVEGRRHYLTDVLTGYSLGSFLSGFIYDSFINYDPSTAVSLGPLPGGVMGQYAFNF